MVILKSFFNRYFHLIFVGLFFAISACLLTVPPIWDEGVYLQLAAHVLSSPFNPFHPILSWVPHPPLLWYLLAVFYSVPRLAPLLASTVCIYFVFYTCKRLYGNEVAKLSVAVLISTFDYLFYSLVMFTDGPVMNFMAVSVLSFLCWEKLGDRSFLGLSGLGLVLASLTKYTAAPIILATFIVWLIILRSKINWLKAFHLVGVIVASLLPLTLWAYTVSKLYGNIIYRFSSVYDLVPTNLILTLISNVVSYFPYTIMLCGLPLISWIRKRSFDLDSKLLIIYLAIVFAFFSFINVPTPYYRYLLPMVPVISVISARRLVEEKVSTQIVFLCFQFLFMLFSLQPLL